MKSKDSNDKVNELLEYIEYYNNPVSNYFPLKYPYRNW